MSRPFKPGDRVRFRNRSETMPPLVLTVIVLDGDLVHCWWMVDTSKCTSAFAASALVLVTDELVPAPCICDITQLMRAGCRCGAVAMRKP